MGGVDFPPVPEGREQPDAHVDGAVAHGKNPPVAGERVAVAVTDVEAALDPGLIVERALVVGPDGQALGVCAVAGGAEGPAEPGVGAIGDDDIPGPNFAGLARVLVSPVPSGSGVGESRSNSSR